MATRLPLFPVLALAVTAGLLAGCGKVAPNRPFEGEDVYPLRYPYEPSDLYDRYYAPDPTFRSLSKEERRQREAQSQETEVIVRQRIQTGAGTVQAPPGAVIQAVPQTPIPATPAAPAVAPSTPVAPRSPASISNGAGYPEGYRPL
jgi:hypothetical protein